MCYISPFEHPLEHDGDGVGIEGGNMSKFAYSVRHKRRSADIPVGTACLGSFQVPFFIGAEDKGVMDVFSGMEVLRAKSEPITDAMSPW